MSTYARDLAGNNLLKPAFYIATFTTTGTGPACDMITGEGLVNAILFVGTGTGSTGPAGVTASILGTAAGGTSGDAYTVLASFPFTGTTGAGGGTGAFRLTAQRPGQYCKLSLVASGTAASFAPVVGILEEQLKQVGG